MTITKQHLADHLWKDYNLTEKDMMELVCKCLGFITRALMNGDRVELRNFGIFEVKVTKPRVGRNPKRPKVLIRVPAKCVAKFTPGKEMRVGVLKLNPEAVKRAKLKRKTRAK